MKCTWCNEERYGVHEHNFTSMSVFYDVSVRGSFRTVIYVNLVLTYLNLLWLQSANNSVGRAMKQTRNLVTPNSPVDSDNNMSGSNNVNDSEIAASGLNINGGSDNGSGNQVSSSYSGVFSYQMLLFCQTLQLRLHYGLHSHSVPVIFCFSAHFCPHLSVTYKLHLCL